MWSNIEVGFGGEETTNFGPRNESGTALYQVETLATISPQDEVLKNPRLLSRCSSSGLCVVAGSDLSVFDGNGQQFKFTVSFDSEVDVVAWSADSEFLVVAESSGTIHIVSVQSEQILFSQELVNSSENGDSPADECNDSKTTFNNMTLEPHDKSSYNLVISSNHHGCFVFSNILLEQLCEAIHNRDVASAQQVKESIRMECIDTNCLHTQSTCDSLTFERQGVMHLLTLGLGDSNMAIWHDMDDTMQPLMLANHIIPDCGIVKCRVSHDGKTLFALDEMKSLSVWDLRTLVAFAYWPDIKVQDFILASAGSGKTDKDGFGSGLKLIILTEPDPQCYLKVFSLPAMDQIYALEVGAHSALVDAPLSQDGIFLIEGVQEDDESDFVSTLRLRCLLEALPETKFHRLLHKRRFEEAIKFAKQFGLDVELVYIVKSGTIVDQVSPWASHFDLDIPQLFASLKDCLEHINKIDQVVETCTLATFPSYDNTMELLNYAKSRVSKLLGIKKRHLSSDSAMLTNKMADIIKCQHRLDTFVMVYGEKKFSGSRWDQFVHADLLPECISLLSEGSISTAAILWKRHQNEFEEKFSEETLERVLSVIAETVKSVDMIPWLQDDLIPFVRRVLPSGQNLLALWLDKRVRNLEFIEKDDWPMNGLKLAELFFAPQKCDFRHSALKPVDCYLGSDFDAKGVNLLKELTQQLKELISLHKDYSCKLMLAEFSQETSSSITFRMLDRVAAPELIPKAIVTMVRPYIKQHKLSKEELLFKYIEDLIERSGNMSSYSYEASWEDRAVAVIKCIKDLDYFCQALQSLMLKAALPWSDLVENIVKQGLAVDHPRVSQLKQHYKVVELRIMLLKYDIHNYNTSDESRACTLWKFLLSQDTETSLADALQVTTVYSREKAEDVYMFRLRYLIEHQKVAECIDLLKCISSEESLICAKRLLIWIQIILQEKEDTDCIDNEYEANEELIHDERREKMVVTEASLSVIRFLLDKDELKPAEFEELKRMLSDLKCIHCLQEEYGKFLSLEDYREKPVREMHLRDYMVSVLSGKLTEHSVKVCPEDLERKPGQAKNFTYNKIYRLAELLRITADHLKGQLAIQAARNGQVELAIKMCKEMYELVPDEKIGEVFYTVAHTLCKVQAESEVNDPENQWFSKEIHELACQAAIICSPDLVADCQELCRCTRLANQVYQQCENEEYGITIQTLSADSQMSVHQKDPFEDWTFCDFYEEDSLVLDSNYAMPLANQFTLCCLPKIHSIDDRQPLQQDNIVGIAEHQIEPDMEQHMIQSISQCTSDLVSLLQENSLALSYVLKTMSICASYTTRRLMGLPTEEKADRLNGIMKPIYGYGSRMVQQYSLNLLHKILGSKKVDVELASEYALMIPYKVAVDKLQSICTSSGHNYGKIIDISRVGKAVALSNSDQQLFNYYERLCTKAEWGHRLNQLQISFSDAFNSDQSTGYQNVLPKMLLHGKNDRQMFKDYCRDFNLNIDDALLLYLEMLLLPSQDQMQTKAAKPPPIDEFVVECVLELIQNKGALQIKLSRILDKLDFYDYERIDFVMVQIMSSCKLNPEEKQTVEMGLKLLSYLSVYTRCSKPSQYEIMYRYKTEEDQLLHGSETLPKMSKTRLPFHPLLYGSPWKIIIPELDASTVSSLQPIAEVLKLLPDQMNMIAIKNEMDKVLKQWELQERTLGESSDDTGWNSNKRLDLKTLENFKTLFMNIKDCEMSVAAARYVAKQLPRGPDQVMVLKFCTMLACRWKDSTQSDPKTNEIATHTYDKLTDVYNRLSTEQVLYKYNLADPAYLMLANNPARLIFQLYEHKSIEERGSAHSTDFPDIHTAADKIAAATDCTVQKIRQILFDKWMPPQICKTDTSDDILLDSEPIEMTEDERSFRRVVYLLQYGEVEQNASSLVKSISEHSGLSIASRVRAIRCLFALLKDRDIEKIALVPASKLRECLQTYLYMTQLETLNITMSVDEFTSCNKVELVRRLWRNHNHEPKAVRLISDLCLQYKINDIQLWNGLLQQFLVFNTMNYLKYVIVKLSAIQELWQVPSLVRSWRSVILQPLTAVSPPLNDVQEKVCHESLLLLLCCPVISDIDMIEFSRQFLRLQMTSHALACLLLVSHTEKKKRQIQVLLRSGCHAVILDQIHKLSLKRLFLPQIDQIVSTVFDNIVSTENYATLMSTPHCEAFQNYIAKTKNIDGMLCKLLETNRVEDGVKLVNLYYQHNAETPPANQSAKNTMKEGTLKLKIYLETHHLLDKLECDEAESRDHLDV